MIFIWLFHPPTLIVTWPKLQYFQVLQAWYHTIPAELENIAIWAKNNNLKLNQSKSHEMIVRKPRAGSSTNPPATTHGIKRVREMVVLGVTLTDTLSFRPHVDRIVARTAQTSYMLYASSDPMA